MMGTDGALSVIDEIAAVEKNLPNINFQTTTAHFCTVIYSKLPNRRIKVTLTFPDEYPCRELIVDVATDGKVPPGLKKKLERELEQVASFNKGRYNQVEPVLTRLRQFVDTNRFVACWKELRQVVDIVQKLSQAKDTKGTAISINDVQGVIKLKLCNGNYFYSCSITIDDAYPTTLSNHDWGKACLLVKEKANIPPNIEQLLTIQAHHLVRFMQDGMSADDAFVMSNPVKLPKGIDKGRQNVGSTLKGLHRDTGNSNIKKQDSARKKCKTSNQGDPIVELNEWEAEEKSRMSGYNISSFDGSDPQPSLLSLVTFLVNKIQRLPEQICPLCKELSLPNDPNILKSYYDPVVGADKRAKIAQRNRPVRTYCGCWYHYKCLHEFITQPPFGAACPEDKQRVYHPDWPEDMQELERAWAMKQAKVREIADAASAFM